VAAPDDPASMHQHRANRDAGLAQAALGFLACMNSSAVIRSQHKRVEPARARRSAAATALLSGAFAAKAPGNNPQQRYGVSSALGASLRVMRAAQRSVLTGFLGIGTASTVAQAPKMWTPEELFRRNICTREDQDTAFPPYKIVGNPYSVGTKSLGSFLIATPQGHILINSDYERNVPRVHGSIEQLGFKYTDIKILLGSHAPADHMEGDTVVKELTGATVVAMAKAELEIVEGVFKSVLATERLTEIGLRAKRAEGWGLCRSRNDGCARARSRWRSARCPCESVRRTTPT
jgi:hypothetical protein